MATKESKKSKSARKFMRTIAQAAANGEWDKLLFIEIAMDAIASVCGGARDVASAIASDMAVRVPWLLDLAVEAEERLTRHEARTQQAVAA